MCRWLIYENRIYCNNTILPNLNISIQNKDGLWLAFCPALDLMTQGKTFEESQFNIRDALVLFLESCVRRGTLQQVLVEAGYEPVQIKQVENYLEEYLPVSMRKQEVSRA